MLKKSFLIPILFFVTMVYGQTSLSNASRNNDIISNFKHLSQQQLLDTANYYYDENNYDNALICYSFIINTPLKENDFEQQKRMLEAYYKTANINFFLCDYSTAYEFLLKALAICEKMNHESYKSKIYNCIGNIYYRFDKYEIARSYYLKALNLCQATTIIVGIFNNLG